MYSTIALATRCAIQTRILTNYIIFTHNFWFGLWNGGIGLWNGLRMCCILQVYHMNMHRLLPFFFVWPSKFMTWCVIWMGLQIEINLPPPQFGCLNDSNGPKRDSVASQKCYGRKAFPFKPFEKSQFRLHDLTLEYGTHLENRIDAYQANPKLIAKFWVAKTVRYIGNEKLHAHQATSAKEYKTSEASIRLACMLIANRCCRFMHIICA